MLQSVLVANRAEIASRVFRTCGRLGVRTHAVYSEVDADLPFVAEADTAALLGGATPADSYMNIERIIEAAKEVSAVAVHPGYGFLSENADFAQAVVDAGLIWVGPSPEAITAMADKVKARNLVASVGVPTTPGIVDPIQDQDVAMKEARRIGYPIMVKASAGGGGVGMGVAYDEDQLRAAVDTAQGRAGRLFSSTDILLERYVEHARHIEVQVLGLADGRVIAIGDRDCSAQRRHQKVVEEAPAPGLSPSIRGEMHTAAIRAAEAVDYRGAGTVEFLLDADTSEFYFLEMNTRLQVEHPVTEMVTGLDLVEAQLRIADGKPVQFDPASIAVHGHALELRVYAEDSKRFLPSPGTITTWRPPTGPGIRLDTGYRESNTVTRYYDPLIAKLCTWGDTRVESIQRARQAVMAFAVEGPKTNLAFFAELLDEPSFVDGRYHTGIIPGIRNAAG